MNMDDSVKWEQAMQSEYDSIMKNKTWDLVELPEGKHALPCKWVFQEAMNMDDSVKWKQAMQSKYDSIMKNKTWDLVELPEGKHALPCKWVYKLKHKSQA